MKDEAIVTIVALLCLAAYGVFALHKGIDHVLAVIIVAAIATPLGFKLKSWLVSRETA